MTASIRAIVLTPSPRARLSFSVNPVAALELWRHVRAQDRVVLAAAAAPSEWPGGVETMAVDATVRLDWPSEAAQVCLVGIASLTSLAPLILWDLCHRAPVGAEITFIDWSAVLQGCVLDRTYYRDWMLRETGSDGPHRRTYRKVAAAPAERDLGLDRWTFALPMGRPDTQVLQRLVERIGSLGLARAEILVSCPESHADLLPDGVKLVASDPGATLTAKKNSLVKAAGEPNVCLFHDRLTPPRNFAAVVQAFGDLYPITGLQNLSIDPGDGSIRRYSDYHVELGAGPGQIASIDGDGAASADLYGRHLELRQAWRATYAESSIHEYSESCYVTGSLYLAKRAVWQACGQNEAIDWGRLEDVEFGHRAVAECGVPMRVNPFGFVRTDRLRPSADRMQQQKDETFDQGQPPAAVATVGSRRGDERPLLGLTEEAYRGRLLEFCEAWISPQRRAEARRLIALARLDDSADLGQLWVELMCLSVVVRSADAVARFIDAVADSLLVSPVDPAARAGIVMRVMLGGSLVNELARSSAMAHTLAAAADRPLLQGIALSESDLLRTRLTEVWTDSRSRIGFTGDFDAFVAAVQATF